jgi:uncharacterized protein with HEPN domain
MKRDVRIYLNDVLESIVRIEEYLAEITKEGFFKDSRTQDAVLRRLEIIGEAAKNVPQGFRDEHPQIPWKRLAGMRDVLIHAYFGVNLERIWKVVKEDIQDLRDRMRDIIKEMQE